ncbi:MAG: hypothetical protein JEZ03_00690 [Bacteroidales bacterium]|nr:hypothetical protein [Bacteroidales bacterium]
MMRTILLYFIFVLSTTSVTKAQIIIDQPVHIQVDGGLNTYYGDVKRFRYVPTTRDHNEVTLSTSINVAIPVRKTLIIKGQYLYGIISGTEKRANSYFTANTHILTLSGQLILNRLFSDKKTSYFNQRFLSYGSFGIGKAIYSTRLYTLSTNTLVDSRGRRDSTGELEKKPRSTVFPVGFGLSYKVSNNTKFYKKEFIDRIYINIEATMYIIDTDQFDLTQTDRSSKDKFLRISSGIIYVF